MKSKENKKESKKDMQEKGISTLTSHDLSLFVFHALYNHLLACVLQEQNSWRGVYWLKHDRIFVDRAKVV